MRNLKAMRSLGDAHLRAVNRLLPPELEDSRSRTLNSYVLTHLHGACQKIVFPDCEIHLSDLAAIHHVLQTSKSPIFCLDLSRSTLSEEFVKELFFVVQSCVSVSEVHFNPKMMQSDDYKRIEQLLKERIEAQSRKNAASVQRSNRRLIGIARTCFSKNVENFVTDECLQRRTIFEDERRCWMEQLSYHAAVSTRCGAMEEKRRQRKVRSDERTSVVEDEQRWRGQVKSLEHAERVLIAEAQCHIQRQIVLCEQNQIRATLKVREKDDWVLSRRNEKRRFASEAGVRTNLCVLEETVRSSIASEEDSERHTLSKEAADAHSAAKTSEGVRLERLQREEATRRRIEDLARERAEKEEALRQKAMREYLMKQQQAREKLEADSMTVRKSIRHIENAMFNTIQRVGVSLIQFLSARALTFAAGELYEEIVLRAIPELRFDIAQPFVNCFYVDGSEPVKLFDHGFSGPSNDVSRRFVFSMADGWESRARDVQGDFVAKLQKAENFRVALRARRIEEFRTLKSAMIQHKNEQLRFRSANAGAPPNLHRMSQSNASFASETSLIFDGNDSGAFFNMSQFCGNGIDELDCMLQSLFSFGTQHSYFFNDLDTFLAFSIAPSTIEAPVRAIRQMKLTPLSGFVKIWIENAVNDLQESLLCEGSIIEKNRLIKPCGAPSAAKIIALHQLSQGCSPDNNDQDPFAPACEREIFSVTPLDVEMAFQRLKPEFHLRHYTCDENDDRQSAYPWIFNEGVVKRLAEFSCPRLVEVPSAAEDSPHFVRLTRFPEVLFLIPPCEGEMWPEKVSQFMESVRYFASADVSDDDACRGWLRMVRFQCHVVVDSSCLRDVTDWFGVRKKILDSSRVVCTSTAYPQAKVRESFATIEAGNVVYVATLLRRRSPVTISRPITVTPFDMPTLECPYPQLPQAFPHFACCDGPPTLLFDSNRVPSGLHLDRSLPFTNYELHLAVRPCEEHSQSRIQFFFFAERGNVWIGPGDGDKTCIFLGEDETVIVAEIASGHLQQYGSGFSTFHKRPSVTKKSNRSVSRELSLATTASSNLPPGDEPLRDHIVIKLVGAMCHAFVVEDIVCRIRIGVCVTTNVPNNTAAQTHPFECVCYLVPPAISGKVLNIVSTNEPVDLFSGLFVTAESIIDENKVAPVELLVPRNRHFLLCSRSPVVLVVLPSSGSSNTPRLHPCADIRTASAKTTLLGVITCDNSLGETKRYVSSEDPGIWVAAPFESTRWGSVDPRDGLIEALHDVDAEIEIAVSICEKVDVVTVNSPTDQQNASQTPPALSPRSEKVSAAIASFNPSQSIVENSPLFAVGSGSSVEINATLLERIFSVEGQLSKVAADDFSTQSPRGTEDPTPVFGQITSSPGCLCLTVKLATLYKRLPRSSRDSFSVRFFYLAVIEKLLQSVSVSAPLGVEDVHEIFVKISANAMLPPPLDTPQAKPGRGKVKEVPFNTVLLSRKKVTVTSTSPPSLPGSSTRPSVLLTTSTEMPDGEVPVLPTPETIGSLRPRTAGKVMLFPFASQCSEVSKLVEEVLHFRHHWRVHEPSLRSAAIQIALTAPPQATHQVALIDRHFVPTLCAFPTTMTSADCIALESLQAHDRSSPLYRAWSGNLTSPRRKEAEAKAQLQHLQDATLVFPVDRLLALLAENADDCDEIDKQRVVDFIISCCCRLILIASPTVAASPCSVTLRVGYTDRSIRVYGSHTVSWSGTDSVILTKPMTHFTGITVQAIARSESTRVARGRCTAIFSIPTGAKRPSALEWPSDAVVLAEDMQLITTESANQKKLFRTKSAEEKEDFATFTVHADHIDFEFDTAAEHAAECVAKALNALSLAVAPAGCFWRLMSNSETSPKDDYDSLLLAVARTTVLASVDTVCEDHNIFPSLPCSVTVDGTFAQPVVPEESQLIHLAFAPVDLSRTAFCVNRSRDFGVPWGAVEYMSSEVKLVDSFQVSRANGRPRVIFFFKSILVAHVTYTAEMKGGIPASNIPTELLLDLVMTCLRSRTA